MHLTILFLLLIAHLLGDFYLQSRGIAAGKETRIGAILLHTAIYLGLVLLFSLFYLTLPMALYLLGLALFHFLVDWLFRKKDFTLLLIDQSLHIAAILLVAHIFAPASGNALAHWVARSGGFTAAVSEWLKTPRNAAILFFLLLNLKPANILIVKLLNQCGLSGEENPAKEPNHGAVIGNLERILTFILILCGEYLAGTLVVALKSIGRIKKLDDKEFSDKFIIGSLFSLMIPVLSAIVINHL